MQEQDIIKLTCHVCKEVISSRVKLGRHLAKYHEGEKINTCGICSVELNKNNRLQRKDSHAICLGCDLKKSRAREERRRLNPKYANYKKLVHKKWYERLKKEIFNHYGNECKCCKLDDSRFLSIDHIKNDGADHRRIIGKGRTLYNWLKSNNFPKGFQTLCFNCNFAKGIYGKCPHKIKEQEK